MASGYDINNFILSNRTAPQQIFWSHGNCAFDIDNIDKRISHFEQKCKEFDWRIFNIPISKEFLVGTAKDKKEGLILKETIKKYYDKDTIFLGTIGRLVKLESKEYIKALSEIMKQNPNTIYLACGVGNNENVKALMEKHGVDLSRVQFLGQVNSHIFGWVIDVWPDTFPLRQGQSRVEYREKDGVIIGMEKYYTDKAINLKKRIAIKNNLIYPLASNKEEYIKLVTLMVKDKEKYQEVKKLYNLVNPYYHNQVNVKDIL